MKPILMVCDMAGVAMLMSVAFTRVEMDSLLSLADKGIRELIGLQKAALSA